MYGPTVIGSGRLQPPNPQAAVKEVFCSMDYEAPDHCGPGLTTLAGLTCGSIDVLHYGGRGRQRSRRGMQHIRSDSGDDFLLTLPIEEDVEVHQRGATVRVSPGSFALISTAWPFEAAVAVSDAAKCFSGIQVRISGSQLRERIPHADDCCDTLIQIGNATGRIMLTLFKSALAEGQQLYSGQIERLGRMLIDSVANTTDGAPELANLQSGRQGHRGALQRQKIDSFILNNLSNPALDADLIAAHCRITARKLREIFNLGDDTLTSYVREQRLRRCKSALQSHSLRDHAVFEIALKWGFNDPAHFSRIYRGRFGVSPSGDR